MIRDASPAALSAFAFALGLVGFSAGFATSSTYSAAPAAVQPIVEPNAWNEGAPVQPVGFLAPANSQAKCDPWQVSDVAMEEVLEQMIRHGWRAPTQGEAIAALDNSTSMAATYPYAPMPQRRVWNAAASSEDVEQITTDEVMPTTAEAANMPPVEAVKDDRPPA